MNPNEPRPGEESEDFRKDLIAGASLGPCKNLAREILRARYFADRTHQIYELEEQFLECINRYSQKFMMWGTSRTENGNVYYFNRQTKKSQWERPKELEEDILKGKTAMDREEPWMDCEFLHINLMQCEKSSERLLGDGCRKKYEKLVQCMVQKTGDVQATYNEDDEDDEDY